MTDSAQLCEICRRVEACDPHGRHLSEWAHLDVAIQHQPAAAPQQGLVLVTDLPTSGTLPERTELQLDGGVVGTVTFTCCPACRTATLGYVYVVAGYRRLGYGRTLVAATRERLPEYLWTAPLPDRVIAQAFRSRVPYPPARPPCVHQTSSRDH
jgi:GNAT superfamily N-acetyltransferase